MYFTGLKVVSIIGKIYKNNYFYTGFNNCITSKGFVSSMAIWSVSIGKLLLKLYFIELTRSNFEDVSLPSYLLSTVETDLVKQDVHV